MAHLEPVAAPVAEEVNLERYPSHPTGLTPTQERVRVDFWQAVLRGLPHGAPSAAVRLSMAQTTVQGARIRMVARGLMPQMGSTSKLADPAWRAAAPEEFLPPWEGEPAVSSIDPPPGQGDPDAMPPLQSLGSDVRMPMGRVAVAPGRPLADDLLTALQRHKDAAQSMDGLADVLDVSPRRLREAIEELQSRGYNVFTEGGHLGLTRQDEGAAVTTIPTDGERIRFGAVSDTHLCSKRERLDVLSTLYDWYAEEGVSTVYHGGNWIEGEARFNVREIHKFGMDAQIGYFLQEYPQRPGIITKIVSGDDHEGWYQQREGISIGRHMERCARDAGREDLVHLGYMEHDVAFTNDAGQFVMRVMHPGGGSAYALSYRPQKIVESFSGGEKPAVLLLGHYHKLEYLPAVRNVRVVQLGCTADQSVWARKKPIEYQLGGWLIELVQCPRSGACIGAKFQERTFFNREFYRQWEDAA